MTGGECLEAEYRLRTATSQHWSLGQEDDRGCVVKRHLIERCTRAGSQEVSKEPQNPTTEYVGPACVWC